MIDPLTEPFIWERYSKRARQKIAMAQNFGHFRPQELQGRQLRYLQAQSGEIERGAQIRIHWLVDPFDGVIVDARYELFGPSLLVAALEACIEIIVGKSYDRARRVHAALIERHLRDNEELPALPSEAEPYLGLIGQCLEQLASQCGDIALAPLSTPLPEAVGEEGGDPQWLERPELEKLAIVRGVIEEQVRPYVEMDAGGVEVVGLQGQAQVVIRYSGACSGCLSSTGSTLAAIEGILRSKVHPSIAVIPEL